MRGREVIRLASPQRLTAPTLVHAARMGKTTVPVRPLVSIYAHFKYVEGIPSWTEGRTVSYDKLKYLNNLIDRLVRIRSKIRADYSFIASELDGSTARGNGSQSVSRVEGMDPMIRSLQQELRTEVVAQKPPFGGQFAGAEPLISLSA